MKKHFDRYPIKSKRIFFRKGKNIISRNRSVFCKKYNVHCDIKILRSDFKLIKKNMNRFTHFNIQNTVHKPGNNYLVTKIHKRGYFDGTTFTQPILDSKNFILVKCLSAKNNVDYADLKEKVFKYSLGNIKNVNTLKKTIKRRYKKSLAHLSGAEKLSLGVAITELKIIKRF